MEWWEEEVRDKYSREKAIANTIGAAVFFGLIGLIIGIALGYGLAGGGG
jgi:hypothetical protein